MKNGNTLSPRALWGLYRNPRRDRRRLIAFRDRELRRLIEQAYNQVPFYRDWFDSARVRPAEIQRAEDLSLLPLLSKHELRNAPLESRLARGADPAKLISHSTSGSSGEPFTIYRTRSEENLLRLFRLRAARQYGFRLGDRRADVTSPLDAGLADPLHRFAEKLRLAPVWSLQATLDPAELLAQVARINPDVLTGYPGALAGIAERLPNDPEERPIRPRLVVTGGEPMTTFMRAQIERGFDAPVYDMYGSSEFNLLAWQCPRNDHFHICDDNVIVEILANGVPVQEGEQGEIVVTGLFARTMPFIRFRTGDLATKGAETCSCGQPFSTLGAIQGRSSEYMRLPDGRAMHPFAVGNSLSVRPDGWVEQYQLVQASIDRIVLRVKPRRPSTPGEQSLLIEEGRRICHPARFELEFVDHFEWHPSGKFRPYLNLDDASSIQRGVT